jgi:hypothetical protein
MYILLADYLCRLRLRFLCGGFLGQDMLALVLGGMADNEPAQDNK